MNEDNSYTIRLDNCRDISTAYDRLRAIQLCTVLRAAGDKCWVAKCGKNKVYDPGIPLMGLQQRMLASIRSEHFIVCAAIKCLVTNMIVYGDRHYDKLMNMYIDTLPADLPYFEDHNKVVQGFLDSNLAFLDRYEAWAVALKAGQIVNRVGGDTINGGKLFSENLY